jgi:hypothetical protein
MKATLFGLCAVLAAGVAGAQAPMDMKPGLWEMRILKMEQNGQDMLAMMRQAMASVPPEQRKQMGMSGDDPTITRMCYSAAMVKGDGWLTAQNAQKQGCSPPKVNRSGNRSTFELTCKDMTSKGEYTTASDQISMKTETLMSAGGGKNKIVQEMQMKFLGSDCGDVKPLN